MPLLRYFLCVGGTLLALLLMSDAWLPKSPLPAGPVADLSMIRIHSDRKWPTPLVFDTSLPAAAPMQTAQAGIPPVVSPTVPSPPTTTAAAYPAAARQAYAQMSAAKQIAPAAGPARPEAKPRPSRRTARKNPTPPMVIVAQHSPLGFFW